MPTAMDDAFTKFNQYVNALWKSRADGVRKAQGQLLTWLFTVHGAGIAACLGYVASTGIRTSVAIGLGAFTTGLFALLIYGTLFFYLEVHHFEKYKREVKELDSGDRTPQQIPHRTNREAQLVSVMRDYRLDFGFMRAGWSWSIDYGSAQSLR
jgi:hypothetical protein